MAFSLTASTLPFLKGVQDRLVAMIPAAFT